MSSSWTELGQEALSLERQAKRLAELWIPDHQKIHDLYMKASVLWNQAEMDEDCTRCFHLAIAHKPEEEKQESRRRPTKIVDYFQRREERLAELRDFM